MLISSVSIAGLIGVGTIVSSVLVKLIGIPDQIIRIHRRKSTEGVSLAYHLLGFFAYVLWTLHGLIQQDYVIVTSQSVGIVTTVIILFQFALYRPRSNSPSEESH